MAPRARPPYTEGMNTRTKVSLGLGAVALGAAAAAAAAARRRTWPGFRGRSVLITGGSRGLGLALAREFAWAGARVAICARDAGELERAREDLAKRGSRVLATVCDVTDPRQAEAVVRLVEQRFGVLDVLVNNAGVMSVGPQDVMTAEDYEEAMRVHFYGPLHTILAAVPGMRARGDGRIVNVVSVGGKVAVPHLIPYDASKFALAGLSEGLRAELAADNVWVTTVIPGLMRTGSPIHARFKGRNKVEYGWFAVSGALPFVTMDAARAARAVADACRRGRAELVLTFPAKAAVPLQAMFPGLTSALLALINKALPTSARGTAQARSGRESESFVTRSGVTRLSRDAERDFNQR